MSKKQKARIKEKREEKKKSEVKKKAKLRHKDTKTLVNAVNLAQKKLQRNNKK